MPALKLNAFRKLFVILLILLCILSLSNDAKAQTDINTSFSDRMNYIVQQLEKNRVPNGLLLDYAMEFAKLSNFDGTALTDSNKVMSSEFWEIYNTLYLSRIHPNGFTIQSPSVFDSLWYNQRDTGKIVLAGLFYNYSRFRDDAVQSNLITIQNEQAIDKYVNGVWQNPYQGEKTFAISPSTEFYEGKNLQVVLPANLWQTNAGGEVSNMSIDFNDGQGYRTLTAGQQLTLNYADTGTKIWKYRLQLSGGQYLYCHSQVKIKNTVIEAGCSGCRFGPTPREVLPPFTADEPFQEIAGRGLVTIQYRDPDFGLRRPLIVVEGFDAGHITNPELRFGTSTINDFYRTVNALTSGSPNLDNVIRNFPEYDIIYVDWRNGTDFLQRNGLLLETIIRWVNNNKEPLPGGGFADNVVLGISMGGAISRWALRDMETRLNQQHNTRMFISMDAPQQGANVPAAYQHLAKHARSIYLQTNVWGGVELFQFITGGPSPFRVLSIADRPASRQMLINWVDGSGNIDNTMHDQWQIELRNMGYPAQDNIRNIAISNGTECGTTQPFAPGAELLNINGKANTRFLGDILGQLAFPISGFVLNWGGFYLGILPGRNDLKYDFIANAQPQQGTTQRIYHGKISYTKKILWLIPITVTITERNVNNNSSLLPADFYPGGEINTGINVNDINFQNALVKFSLNFSHIPTFCFIPTPSALDIGLNNIALNNADYLARYIGGAPPVPPRNTPFQNFVTAFNGQVRNEQHTGFFPRNGNWLAQELTQVGNPPPNPPVANCSAFCDLVTSAIAGNGIVACNTNYSVAVVAGVNYFWQTSTNLVINGPGTNNTVQVSPITGGGQGWVQVTVAMPGCGQVTIRRDVILIDYNEAYITAEDINIEVIHPQDWSIAAYRWYMDGSFFKQTVAALCKTPFALECHYWSVSFVTDCGESPQTYPEPIGCGYRVSAYQYTVYPNPVKNDLFVAVNKGNIDLKISDKNESIQIVLYGFYTNQIARQWRFENNQNLYKLNVAGLKKGQYILQLRKGKYRQSEQVIIE